MKNSKALGLVSLMLLIFSACNSGGDAPSPSTAASEGPVSAMTLAVSGALKQVNQYQGGADQARALNDHTRSVNATFNCSGGGTITIVGTFTDTTSGTNPIVTDLTYNHTFTFNQCVSVGNDGKSYLITSPGVVVAGSSSNDVFNPGANETFSGQGQMSLNGELTINVDISCGITLNESDSYTATLSSSDFTGSFSGTFCGTPVNGNVSTSGS
jgi:hypothetical protein